MERWREELYYNSLMHYGVRGMQKGRRRYTNPDGSLNAAGKARYGVGLSPAMGAAYGTLYPAKRATANAQTFRRLKQESYDKGKNAMTYGAASGAVNKHTKPKPEYVNKHGEETKMDPKLVPTNVYDKSNWFKRGVISTRVSQDTINREKNNPEYYRTAKKPEKSKPSDIEVAKERNRAIRENIASKKGLTANDTAKIEKRKQQERAERERASVGKTANPSKKSELKKTVRNILKKLKGGK